MKNNLKQTQHLIDVEKAINKENTFIGNVEILFTFLISYRLNEFPEFEYAHRKFGAVLMLARWLSDEEVFKKKLLESCELVVKYLPDFERIIYTNIINDRI